jgi:Ca2+-transporting ATPase
MALGAWRISQARGLTPRAAAIETLGSATALCTDQTGTLTENRMAVDEFWLSNGKSLTLNPYTGDLPSEFQRLLTTGVLASAPDPVDPMEKAFHDLSQERVSVGPERGGSSWVLERTYGLRPDLLAMTQAWHTDDRSTSLIAAKGAPEAIAGLSRLSADDLARVRRAADEMGARGLRVLGIAQAFASHPLPDSQRDFSFEFLGLVGLADPLRAAVPDAMRECRSAGIRVIMITGDYPVTARAIARQAGIDSERVISGQELTSLSESELESEVGRTSVFARIMPQQKLRIVNALKVNGEVVAMTGDGVNDAPSLKAADIGVAMGGRGTDVAREASSIVLLDDDFRSIVQAVRLGRRIYDNLRKAMGFIFAVHVPIAGLAILPLALGLPILFGPVHIAFLEMIIDPVCSLAFEAETEERNIMRRPPRRPEEPLFSLPFVAWSILQGAVGFGAVAAAYLLAINGGMPEAEVRALAFFSLVMVIISLILVNRSFSASILTALDRPNRALGLVVLFAMTVLSLTLLWPTARDLFRFGPLHPDDLGITLALAAAVLITLELLKYVLKRSLRGAKAPASAG